VVDRTRVVARELALLEPSDTHHPNWAAQLDALQVRTRLLVKALRAIYSSLGLFATAALVSVVGSIATYYGPGILFELTAGLALLAGAVAVVGLASGCFLMVQETRLAVQSLGEEAKIHTSYRR
jgi:hypothetical protein